MKHYGTVTLIVLWSLLSLLAQYAQDIVSWISCGYISPCTERWIKLEALNIGVLLIFIVTIVTAVVAEVHKKLSTSEAVGAVIVAVVGSLLALLKAGSSSFPSDAHPKFPVIAQPYFYWFVALLLFGAPILLMPRKIGREAGLLSIYARIGFALALGALIGGSLQIVAQGGWNAIDGRPFRVAPGFIVRPSGTAMAIGSWTLVLIHPWLCPSAWSDSSRLRRMVWAVLFSSAMLLLISVYGALFMDDPWAGLSLQSSTLVASALLLPGLVTVVSFVSFGALPLRGRILVSAVALAMLGGGSLALIVSEVSQRMSLADRSTFVLVQAASAGVVVLVVAASDWLVGAVVGGAGRGNDLPKAL